MAGTTASCSALFLCRLASRDWVVCSEADGWPRHRAGSFIAAARNAFDEDDSIDDNEPPIRHPRWNRPTSSLFNRSKLDTTQFPPFYYATPPDIEACKADSEGEVIIHALRRLSSLPVMGCSQQQQQQQQQQQPSLTSRAAAPSRQQPHRVPTLSVSQELTQVLLEDTETYIASLLFKPETPAPRSAHAHAETHPDDETAPPTARQQTLHHDVPPPSTPSHYKHLSPYQHPYSTLAPSVAPSSSRAWATAAYLYLHVILEFMWDPREPVDAYLLRWLLDNLQADVARTESQMRLGACSTELWLWKVVVGAYALTVASVRPEAEAWADSEEEELVEGGGGGGGGGEREVEGERGGGGAGLREVVRLRAWFDEKIRSWTTALKITEWETAKQVLGKIAWLQTFEGEKAVERIWKGAVAGDGLGRSQG